MSLRKSARLYRGRNARNIALIFITAGCVQWCMKTMDMTTTINTNLMGGIHNNGQLDTYVDTIDKDSPQDNWADIPVCRKSGSSDEF